MKVCFETFGCRLNRAEALDEEAKYLAEGWELTARHADADLIVVRGCSVTSRAQHDCEKLIEHIRHRYPATRLLVRGCIEAKSDAVVDSTSAGEAIPTRTSRAYLKVQDGCAGKCTFCIVPKFRGQSVSLGFEGLLDRAKRFADAGYREIVVTGCNLALYASEGRRLPELLDALTALDPAVRVRIGSLEPVACATEVVRLMSERTNLCRFLHLPIQSGSGTILSAMRRPYQIHEVEELIYEAVKRLPNLGLGCDLMTGFPGEGDLEFMSTKGLLRRHPFSNVHIFPYSKRPGTLAAALPNQVPKNIRDSRARELSDSAVANRRTFAKKFLGHEVEIVVEDAEKISGWTSEYLWCESVIPAGKLKNRTYPRKSSVRLVVQDVRHGILRGRII